MYSCVSSYLCWFRGRSSSMGNVFVHLCPNISSKTARSANLRHSVSRESDTAYLCSNEAHSNDQPTYVPDCNTTVEAGSYGRTDLLRKYSSSTHGPKIVKDHVNFPFLTDNEIAKWIVNSRFMFILRGPPGSGKSYIAECISVRFPTAQICSADDFWYQESNGLEYQFDISRVAEAHQWCQTKAHSAAQSGLSPLVIDNTNVRAWETRFYTDLARRFSYTVIMVTPQTPWRFDTNALALKNVHFVGIQAIEAKVRNFEHVFPLYYGWLWPGTASNNGFICVNNTNSTTPPTHDSWPVEETLHLLTWAWDSLVTIVGLPDVRIQLASALGMSDSASVMDVLRHWYSATYPAFGSGLRTSHASSVPHITAKYARFGHAPDAERYGLSGAVTSSLLGRLFTVQVTGLFFSLRTVGLRIRLPSDDLVLRHLWSSDDQAVLSNGSAVLEASLDPVVPPQRPVGCRAHVTLALAPDVSAVETGLDLLRVVDAELAQRPGHHVAIIPGGSVRRVTVQQPATSPTRRGSQPQFVTAPLGCDYMYVFDLDFPQHHRVLFAGAY
ncbi:hypothetical protein P879_03175 [Paragonimus westermani]|uniref:2',3'-cyclic-nucleotide 3'-phosphodiesterase n=1 Tax=Paragonimus westermani TaxID=34504 RepID=A0A8T0DF98_9TREM|nr:hypothetical protein P879_03175 [Paragonimus westermani]